MGGVVMPQIKHKNYTSADRKRNMVAFGMFPINSDLSWIQNAVETGFSSSVASFGSTVTFNWDQATSWIVTVTGDVVSSQILNGGSSTDFENGNTIILQVIQDATGRRNFPIPATVRKVDGYSIDDNPNTITTLYLQWRDGAWDFISPPIVGPVS